MRFESPGYLAGTLPNVSYARYFFSSITFTVARLPSLVCDAVFNDSGGGLSIAPLP